MKSFLFLLLICLLAVSCRKKNALSSALLPDTLQLRNGDMVFRKGRSNLSHIIMTIHPGEFSHTGILFKSKDGWSVIHASENDDNGGREEVTVVSLSQFISGAKGIGIARVKCTSRQAGTATRAALKMASDKIPFDAGYDLTDTTKVYCTEMVYLAYKTAGINLLKTIPLNRPAMFSDYLFPEDLWKNRAVTPLFMKILKK